MNANLDKIAQELYGKIQTRFTDIKIGDENAEVLSKKQDIPNARFFEFEYIEGDEPLGTIAITLDPNDGIVVQVSGELVDNTNETINRSVYKFIRSFRQFAKDRLLNFDIRNIGKSNLDKRDYHFQSKRKEPVIMENKLFGTSKISYQDLGEARLVIKHSKPINPNLAAGRTMHIESIYVENADGERFKYPFKHLHGARALAEHLKHGGNPYDAIGKHITGLSEEMSQLRKFKGFVNRNAMVSETLGAVNNQVVERIELIKKEIHGLQRPYFYEAFAESFEEREEQIIPEDIINDLVDRLTIRTFNEELKAAFPFIYKLIGESNIPVCELGIDDLLSEEDDDICQKCQKDPCICKRKKDESFDPEASYSSFMESIVEDVDNYRGALFSTNPAIQHNKVTELNQLLQHELKGGPNGINAIESLRDIIDDPNFIAILKTTNPDLDVRPLIQHYIINTAPNLAYQLEFNGTSTEPKEEQPPAPETELPPGPEEEQPPAPETELPPGPEEEQPPAPGATPPLAEGTSRLRLAIKNAYNAGATLDTKIDFGYQEITIKEAIHQCGMTLADCGIDEPANVSGLKEMLRYISGFFNREARNFPLGGQRIKIRLKKDFEEGLYPDATSEDLIKVLQFITMKDPSQSEHDHIMKLAGMQPASTTTISINAPPNRGERLDQLVDELSTIRHEQQDTFESILKLAGLK